MTPDLTHLQHIQQLLEFHGAQSCVDSLIELKSFVLLNGIPEDPSEFGGDSLRARIWKLFLGVPLQYDVDSYLEELEVDLLFYFLFVQILIVIPYSRLTVSSLLTKLRTMDFVLSREIKYFGSVLMKLLWFGY